LVGIDTDIIFPEKIDELGCELIVFASRHKSKAEKKTLSVHPTGNFSKAMFGGNEKELSFVSANAMRNVFLEMVNREKEFEVCLEVTHHGPTQFKTPLFFVEIGSTEKEWVLEDKGELVAESILKGLESKEQVECVIGFGGGHYAPVFSQKERDFAFGHMCAKYGLDELNEELVKQMVEKTVGNVSRAFVDSGMKSEHKKKVCTALDNLGINY